MAKRVALVTGGGRGIGRAIALALAADGRAVAIGDVDEEGALATASAVESDGGRALALALDVTDGESVRAGVGRSEEEFGRVDIVVSNAGWDELVPLLDTDEAFWDKVIEINF